MKSNYIFKTELGAISINDISLLDDSIGVCLEIDKVSSEIQKAIDSGIEKMKAKSFEDMKETYIRKGYKWSELGVKIFTQYLWIRFNQDKSMNTLICVGFEDSENPHLYGDLEIKVDLSTYRNELMQIILKAITDQYL